MAGLSALKAKSGHLAGHFLFLDDYGEKESLFIFKKEAILDRKANINDLWDFFHKLDHYELDVVKRKNILLWPGFSYRVSVRQVEIL